MTAQTCMMTTSVELLHVMQGVRLVYVFARSKKVCVETAAGGIPPLLRTSANVAKPNHAHVEAFSLQWQGER